MEEAGIAWDLFLIDRQREYETNTGETWCIPAIVRRQEKMRLGIWEVGFSFPWFRDGHRIRLAGEVMAGDVVKVFSPFDILKCPADSLEVKWRAFVGEIWTAAKEFQITAGIYGSAALSILSGLPYLHSDSDIDLIVDAAPVPKMELFYNHVEEMAFKRGIKADMEIRVADDGDIKAQELFSRQKTIIVRGIDSIRMENREKMENKINILTKDKI